MSCGEKLTIFYSKINKNNTKVLQIFKTNLQKIKQNQNGKIKNQNIFKILVPMNNAGYGILEELTLKYNWLKKELEDTEM